MARKQCTNAVATLAGNPAALVRIVEGESCRLASSRLAGAAAIIREAMDSVATDANALNCALDIITEANSDIADIDVALRDADIRRRAHG
ncbi:MAG TPA: hypothetical protein VF936_11840 [Burkholderiales bacterium]